MSTSTNSSDRQLIARYLGGEHECFAQIVARWENRVVNLAYRLTGDLEEARDIGQTSFVKVYRGLHSFNGSSRFSTWLYRVVVNASRDRLRRRAARASMPITGAGTVDASTPEKKTQRREVAKIVSGAVAALPEAEREVVVLKHYQEKTFSEIAEIVGAPASTVKSRMERAMRNLRPLLRGLEE